MSTIDDKFKNFKNIPIEHRDDFKMFYGVFHKSYQLDISGKNLINFVGAYTSNKYNTWHKTNIEYTPITDNDYRIR